MSTEAMLIVDGRSPIETPRYQPMLNHALSLVEHVSLISSEGIIKGELYTFESMYRQCRERGIYPSEFLTPLGLLKGTMGLEQVLQQRSERYVRGSISLYDPKTLVQLSERGLVPVVKTSAGYPQKVEDTGFVVNLITEYGVLVDPIELRRYPVGEDRAQAFDTLIDELGMHVTLRPLQDI